MIIKKRSLIFVKKLLIIEWPMTLYNTSMIIDSRSIIIQRKVMIIEGDL